MIFDIILTIILFIALITAIYNVIVGIRIKDDRLIVISGIGAGLIGMVFSMALSSILFNI